MEYNEPWIINTKAEGIRFYKNHTPTLQASLYKEPLLVLVTPKSTSTPLQHINITSEDIPTMETQLQLIPQNSPTSDFLSEASLARLLAWLASVKDLKKPGALSFLTFYAFSITKDPDILYSKTSKVYLLTKREKLSRQYLGFLPTWGIESNGRYLTAKTSAYHRTGSACTLSDILEPNVDDKYFLSPVHTNRILNIYKDTQRIPLPPDMKAHKQRARTLLKVNSMHKKSVA